jgi:hypothetical protein
MCFSSLTSPACMQQVAHAVPPIPPKAAEAFNCRANLNATTFPLSQKRTACLHPYTAVMSPANCAERCCNIPQAACAPPRAQSPAKAPAYLK